MDAATKPPWMGLRRPVPPDPPRHPTESQLLTLLRLLRLLRQVQGAALLSHPPSCTMGPTPPGHRPDVEQAVFRSLRAQPRTDRRRTRPLDGRPSSPAGNRQRHRPARRLLCRALAVAALAAQRSSGPSAWHRGLARGGCAAESAAAARPAGRAAAGAWPQPAAGQYVRRHIQRQHAAHHELGTRAGAVRRAAAGTAPRRAAGGVWPLQLRRPLHQRQQRAVRCLAEGA